jgi:hypothetical protein
LKPKFARDNKVLRELEEDNTMEGVLDMQERKEQQKALKWAVQGVLEEGQRKPKVFKMKRKLKKAEKMKAKKEAA